MIGRSSGARSLLRVGLLLVVLAAACAPPAASSAKPVGAAPPGSAAAPAVVQPATPAAASAASAPASPAAPAVQPLSPHVTVAVGLIGIFVDIGILIAQERSYFKDEASTSRSRCSATAGSR